MTKTIAPGDFTGLANDYSQHRPDYCQSVLNALLGLLDKPISEVDFVDVGAGTGIWTRMVSSQGVKSVVAVEPNNNMRANGVADNAKMDIKWVAGSAEDTGLLQDVATGFQWLLVFIGQNLTRQLTNFTVCCETEVVLQRSGIHVL